MGVTPVAEFRIGAIKLQLSIACCQSFECILALAGEIERWRTLIVKF